MQKLITVVVPTYRRPALLHNCVQALASQRFDKEAYEVIIVSDGPDELTQQAVAQWADKNVVAVRCISLPEKKGPAAARNAGWQQANGVMVAFTDDDCLPDPLWLEAIWGAYRHEHEMAFTGKVIVPVTHPPTDFARNTQGLESAAFVTANCACTKKALQRVQGFDEQFTMAWREDSDLEFKLLQFNIEIRRIEGAVVVHPVRQAPWGVSMKEQKKGMFNALLYKKYPALYRQQIQPQPPWNYYGMMICWGMVITGLLTGVKWVTLAAFATWTMLMAAFINRRLSGTSHTFRHVTEMIVTSLAIPFLSVYWQLYGAIKYRILFI